ncbi:MULTISPECIES: hypothetical protein [unclassified Martelella]|uniref:hypothetical protein n=1 Tax=unclassified Martelella TaxID=2629616 RepID=UPI0025C3EECD|nr:hypothetical protein [Martelella sp.]
MTETENRKAVRRAFLKFYRQWPTFGDDSDERAFAEWQALKPAERQGADAMLPAFLAFEAMNGRTVKFAASTYLRERRWTAVPEGAEGSSGPVIAATFGKAWMAERFARLCEPCARLPALTRFQELEIAEGRADRKALWRERMCKMGWPAVNAMNDQAARYPGKGTRVSGEIALLGADFEAVRVGGDLWAAWEAEHSARGWPWLPEMGRVEWVYFPPLGAGTPGEALTAFFDKLHRTKQLEAAQ